MADRSAFEKFWDEMCDKGWHRESQLAWEVWQEAARQEREACAKLVEDYYTHGDHTQGWQDIFAERIRARSSATGEKG